jgi:hypothetical protein
LKIRYIIPAFIIAVAIVISCKKEQPAIPMVADDPCDCVNTFTIGQIYKEDETLVECDTIHMRINYGSASTSVDYHPSFVTFEANNKYGISYQWLIGNNPPIISGSKVSLWFNDTLGTIPVTLIIEDTLNLNCFPNDDGFDTIVKQLTIINMQDPPLSGIYRGFNTDEPNIIFDIKIDTFTFFNDYYYGVYNLPNGFTAYTEFDFQELRTKTFWSAYTNQTTSTGNQGLSGTSALLKGSGKVESGLLEIKYRHITYDTITNAHLTDKVRRFQGRKI